MKNCQDYFVSKFLYVSFIPPVDAGAGAGVGAGAGAGV